MRKFCFVQCLYFMWIVPHLTVSSLYNVLGLSIDATDADIKKSYRRLALELHPDKIPTSCSESEKEALTAQFIDVQNAYETLGSAEARLRYDLSTQGIEYSTREIKQKERYMSGQFKMFAKSRHVRFAFEAHFAKKAIPDISINVAVSARDLFDDLNGNVSFYRSVKCKACGGNGGVNGSCSTCSFCDGSGHANHLFHDSSHRFEQMTHTECGVCGGRGCNHDHDQCPLCKGSGFVMDLTSIAYHLKKGFQDGSELTFVRIGHEDLDGDIGSVKLKFMISFPPMWSVETPMSLNLVHNMVISFKDFENGLHKNIYSISGEMIKVSHRKMDLLSYLTGGGIEDVTFPEKGLWALDGSYRGDLIVRVDITYEDLSAEDILHILEGNKDIHRNGILRKLFDALKPSCTSEEEEGSSFCRAEARETKTTHSKENEKFYTSEEDVSFVFV